MNGKCAEEHEKLPKYSYVTNDPNWEDRMNELGHTTNAVSIPYTDDK